MIENVRVGDLLMFFGVNLVTPVEPGGWFDQFGYIPDIVAYESMFFMKKQDFVGMLVDSHADEGLLVLSQHGLTFCRPEVCRSSQYIASVNSL